MNDESHNSTIEPELEARIVSLVLGEASDFETEELKRLIALRPELAVFQQEMQQVHGLMQTIGAGELEKPDANWKLSADRREAVLAVIRGEAMADENGASLAGVETGHVALRAECPTQLLPGSSVPGIGIQRTEGSEGRNNLCVDAAGLNPGTSSLARRIRVLLADSLGPFASSVRRRTHKTPMKIAAGICVAGFIGWMTVPSFLQQEEMLAERSNHWSFFEKDAAPAEGFRGPTSTLNGTPLSMGFMPGVSSGPEVAEGEARERLIGKLDSANADYAGASTRALSALQQTLNGGGLAANETSKVDPGAEVDRELFLEGLLSPSGTDKAESRRSISAFGRSDAPDGPFEAQLEKAFESETHSWAIHGDASAPVASSDDVEFAKSDTTGDNDSLHVPADINAPASGPASTRPDVLYSAPVLAGTTDLPVSPERFSVGNTIADSIPKLMISPAEESVGQSLRVLALPDSEKKLEDLRATMGEPWSSDLGESEDYLSRDKSGYVAGDSRSDDEQREGESESGESKSKVTLGLSSDPSDFGTMKINISGATGEAVVGLDTIAQDTMNGSSKRGEFEMKDQDAPEQADPQNWSEIRSRRQRFAVDSDGKPNDESRQKEMAQSLEKSFAGDSFGTNAQGLPSAGSGIGLEGSGLGGGNFEGRSGKPSAGMEPGGRGGEGFKAKGWESEVIADGEDVAQVEETLRELESVRTESVEPQGQVARQSIDLKKNAEAKNPDDYRGSHFHIDQLEMDLMDGLQPLAESKSEAAAQPASKEMPIIDGFNPHAGKVPDAWRKNGEVADRKKSDVKGLPHVFFRQGEAARPALDFVTDAEKKPVARAAAPSVGLNETNAAVEAFSTFSLHVSDVSFKLAAAALGRGEWPEAATVRIEGFVNAFDYGDPLPHKEEKVACAVEQSIHPFVQQRNLLRVSMRTAAEGRASNTPLRLTFLLDNSGSMERADRQDTVRRAFDLLSRQLTAIDQVTLISFARQPRLMADKVSGADAAQLVKLIDELPSEGGTNIEAALQLAFEKATQQQTPGAQNRIVLLTDGAVNLGDADPESLSRMVTAMREAGIAFDAAGISAEGLNDEVLEALTRKGDGRYYLLDAFESAHESFASQIAGALRPSASNVKVQVEFNPKRVGSYKLLGFEKHILKQEDFRNDKVDAAEMAAAEAGVAMYQFEAKPDGEGDVGSVSVRFRDLSTGQMVENRWPIPYEADAPRVDQAAPSLRIAASAALLAAKLRGEPLGESVDLPTLSNLVSSLPAKCQSNTRVQQLKQMIEQARQMGGK